MKKNKFRDQKKEHFFKDEKVKKVGKKEKHRPKRHMDYDLEDDEG